MAEGAVQNHRQGLAYLLPQPAEKVEKHIHCRVLPILGAEYLAAREKCCKDVLAPASLSFYQVALAALCLGAAVWVHR